jgi:hypothetical protein
MGPPTRLVPHLSIASISLREAVVIIFCILLNNRRNGSRIAIGEFHAKIPSVVTLGKEEGIMQRVVHPVRLRDELKGIAISRP